MGRRSPIILSALALGAALVSLAGATSTMAADASTKPVRSCFRISQLQSTRPDGDKRIYAKVDGGEVFRLDLKSQCPELLHNQGVVLTPSAGNDVICSAIELDVAARNVDGGSAPCFLDSITRLTPDEVAALPRKARP